MGGPDQGRREHRTFATPGAEDPPQAAGGIGPYQPEMITPTQGGLKGTWRWVTIRPAAPFVLAVLLAVAAAVLWYDAIALSVDRLDGFSSERRDDMVAFYVAAQFLREGRADQIYDLDAVGQEEARVLARPAGYHGGLVYLNPPFVAALFYPLSLLPYPLAQAVWLAVDIAALLISLALLTPELRKLGLKWATIFVLGVFAFFPVFYSLLYVQISPLILLSWVVAYRLLRANRGYWCGFALAASLVKPHLALLPALFLLVTGRRRPLLTFAAAGLLLAAASIALVGADTFLRDYPRLLVESMNWRLQHGIDRAHMFGWQGFLSLVLGGRLPRLERAAAMALSLLTIGLAVYLWRRLRSEERLGRLLLAIAAATVLVSPHINTQDLIVFVLPAAVLVAHARSPFDVLVPIGLLTLVPPAVVGVNLATPFLAALLVYLAVEERGSPTGPVAPLPPPFVRVSPRAAGVAPKTLLQRPVPGPGGPRSPLQAALTSSTFGAMLAER